MKEYIGGEFAYLKKNFLKTSNKKNYIKFDWSTSGRAAFFYILNSYKKKGFKEIHLPAYICDSLFFPVKKLGFKILFYDLDDNLNIKNEFKPNTLILLIHFFGKKIKNIEEIKKKIPKSSFVIEDYTHIFLNSNLLSKKIDNSFFFSLRKHFGFLSGAYSNEISKKIPMNKKFIDIYKKSINTLNFKQEYLNDMINYNFKKENFYLNFIKKKEIDINCNLKNFEIPKKIENLNNNIILNTIRNKRKRNWKILSQLLNNKIDCFHTNFNKHEVPLGFIIKIKNRDIVQKKLRNENIFAPVHWKWQRIVDKKKFPSLYKLSKHILTLPIDQRYDIDDMEVIAKKLKKIV